MIITGIKAFGLGNCPLSPFRKRNQFMSCFFGIPNVVSHLKIVYSFEFSHSWLNAFLEINLPLEDEDSSFPLEVTVREKERGVKATGCGVGAGAFCFLGEIEHSSCFCGMPSEPRPGCHTAEGSLGATPAHCPHLKVGLNWTGPWGTGACIVSMFPNHLHITNT